MQSYLGARFYYGWIMNNVIQPSQSNHLGSSSWSLTNHLISSRDRVQL